MPFRPTLRFLYSYFWKLGFLDGRAGYIFCRLLAIYEFLSVAKYREIRLRANDKGSPATILSDVPALAPQLIQRVTVVAPQPSNGDANAPVHAPTGFTITSKSPR